MRRPNDTSPIRLVQPAKRPGLFGRLAGKVRAVLLGTASGSAYNGAEWNRWFKNWLPSISSADEDLKYDLPTLRIRTRDLYRNTPVGRAVVDTIADSVISKGLRLHSAIDREALRLDNATAERIETQIERRFHAWASRAGEADLTRKENFYSLQRIACVAQLSSGDVFAQLVLLPRAGSEYLLRVKLIEADLIQSPTLSAVRDDKIRNGVQLDDNEAPIGYWLREASGNYRMIPAYGESTGRVNMVHLFRAERPGQNRGAPILAPVVQKIKNLSRYEESELIAALVSSYFTVFVESNAADLSDSPLASLTGAGQYGTTTDDGTANDYEMGPGLINFLRPGEKVSTANPTRPNSNYPEFRAAIMGEVGMATGIPFEMLTKRFDSSYSASRASRLEFWRTVENERAVFSAKFCQPIFEEWLEAEYLAGKIDLPGFEQPGGRAAYFSALWVGDGLGQIDELKEVEAAAARVEHGFSTRQEETLKMSGADWSRNVKRKLAEDQLLLPGVAKPADAQPNARRLALAHFKEA